MTESSSGYCPGISFFILFVCLSLYLLLNLFRVVHFKLSPPPVTPSLAWRPDTLFTGLSVFSVKGRWFMNTLSAAGIRFGQRNPREKAGTRHPLPPPIRSAFNCCDLCPRDPRHEAPLDPMIWLSAVHSLTHPGRRPRCLWHFDLLRSTIFSSCVT